MATTETLEGMTGDLWYHYDVPNDVLYVRRGVPTPAPTYGEENDEGLIIHRADADDAVVAVTIVNWWHRYGQGALPDSLREIAGRVESVARTLPIAA